MKSYVLDRQAPVFFVSTWWFIFALLFITDSNIFHALNIFGFSFLILVPGGLTVLALRLHHLNFWGGLGLTVGISILELMGIGLLINTLLPALGIERPLTGSYILTSVSLFVLLLLVINWMRWQEIRVSVRKYIFFNNLTDTLLAFSPILFVVLSIFGAIRLNNEGGNQLTVAMLALVGIYVFILARFSKSASAGVLPTAIFFLSLSLLLMTSLRGWYITGHDVQREYMTFELAKNIGQWSMEAYKDAYNACLSITILPTIFYNLLRFYDPYVYKVFFQIIFAFVPSILYLIARRYVSELVALVSTVYFIAFPTFFGDMPMLNRQEIAFLFLALMMYILFEGGASKKLRKTLFLLFGLGVVVSHYSTTYSVIIILGFTTCAYPILWRLATYIRRWNLLPHSIISEFWPNNIGMKRMITIPMVIALAGMSFLWSSILTDTASNSLLKVVKETISVIRNNAGENAQSGDVKYSLLSWSKVDLDAALEAYKRKEIDPVRARSAEGVYYDSNSFEAYPIRVADPDTLPATTLGVAMQALGIDPYSFNYIFRQSSAKVLQILFLVGFFYSMFSRKYFKNIETEFTLLAAGSMLFVLAVVVLPVLSVQYGLLRAFQQSLIFFGVFIVIGSLVAFQWLGQKIRYLIATSLACILLLSSTSFISEMTGGYLPMLHLSNAGTYYNLYYAHDSEVGGIHWLERNLPRNEQDEYQSNVQTDRYTSTKIMSITDINPLNDIHPALIRRNAYVFLGFANTNKEQATVVYNGDLINYTYPIDFVEKNKNLLYDNGGSRIYR